MNQECRLLCTELTKNVFSLKNDQTVLKARFLGDILIVFCPSFMGI